MPTPLSERGVGTRLARLDALLSKQKLVVEVKVSLVPGAEEERLVHTDALPVN